MSTVKVTWITTDGRHIVADVPAGHTLMEAALANNVAGIQGECGGALACATCHVMVETTPAPLTAPSEAERDMLELAPVAPTPESRLSCQIIAEPRLSGIVLRVAGS